MKDHEMENHGPPPVTASLEETRLKGHLGHLTVAEEDSLDAFKQLSTEKGYYKPPTSDYPASHDDGTLVRFLRARKFSPQEAFVQFKDTEIWRKENKLDALYEKIDIQDYQEARSVYPQWTGRRDKRGIPVYLYEVGKLDSKKMVAYSSSTSKSKAKGPSPSRMLRLFALYENLTRFVMPLCSAVPGRPNPETPVDQSNNIVDISHVGLKQFWNLRSHMQDASTLATAHYPETLDRIFVIGAPAFFPTVWGWIKKWFDPITTSKIFILSHAEVLPTLSAFMDVSSIPKKYGGSLDFESGMLPVLDPAVKDVLDLSLPDLHVSERMFLTAPVKWVDALDGDMTAVGVGSVDGHDRREVVATLHSLAKLALSRSNRPRMERTPTASIRPTSSPAPQSATASHRDSGTQNPALIGNEFGLQNEIVRQNSPLSRNEPIFPNQPFPRSNPAPIVEPVAQNELTSQAIPGAQNGPIPTIIVPSRPDLERTQTEFVTPAEEPAEIKLMP